jgi:hypothetical protein
MQPIGKGQRRKQTPEGTYVSVLGVVIGEEERDDEEG